MVIDIHIDDNILVVLLVMFKTYVIYKIASTSMQFISEILFPYIRSCKEKYLK